MQKISHLIIAALLAGYVTFFYFNGFTTETVEMVAALSGLLAPLTLLLVIAGYFQNYKISGLQLEKDMYLNFASKIEVELNANLLEMFRALSEKHNNQEFVEAQKRNLDEYALGNRNIIIHCIKSYVGGEKGEGFKNCFTASRAKMYFNVAKNSYVKLFGSLLNEASHLKNSSNKNLLLDFYKMSEYNSLYEILLVTPDINLDLG